MDDIKDNVKFPGEDVVEIYGKRYAGGIFRHFDLGTDEDTFIQIISKKDDEVCVLKTIRLDCVDVNVILENLRKRARQAVQEFEVEEEFELRRIDEDVEALKVMLKVYEDNTDS